MVTGLISSNKIDPGEDGILSLATVYILVPKEYSFRGFFIKLSLNITYYHAANIDRKVIDFLAKRSADSASPKHYFSLSKVISTDIFP